jgi:hypothetical protein
MFEERVIGTRRKLSAEANNGKVFLLLLVAIADLSY